MAVKKKVIKTSVIILALVFLSGCSAVGLIASDMETFTINDQIDIKTTRVDILDVVAEVGRSIEFKVSGIDRGAGSISLTSQTSMFKGVMLGSGGGSNITVTLSDKNKRMEIGIYTWGNFGMGGQKAAEELLKNFKEKLLEKLK